MTRFLYLLTLLSIFFIVGCNTASQTTPVYLKKRFQAVSTEQATIVQGGTDKTSCAICGMYLPDFYKTNHTAVLKNSKPRQYCSLHCLIHDNEVDKSNLYDVKVVDVTSLKFIPAQSAFYVVGSKMPGTMSRVSKYAFAKRMDADRFAKQYGGHVMNFYDAYTVAYEDFVQK